MTTTRDKQLIQTINHNNNTTAVMLMREFLGPDNQWWPMQPIDASQDSAAIDAFSKSLIGSQQSQITTLTTERDSLQSQLTNLQADYDAKVNDNEAKQVQIDSLTEQVATLTAERDARPTQKQLDILTTQVTELASRPTQEQLDTANTRITELETQLNPPNPFPNANWIGFKQAVLTDPAVRRVAESDTMLWPILFNYLSELSSNPARGQEIAWLWNQMETKCPVDKDEINRINGIAEHFNIPLRMNEEGQITL